MADPTVIERLADEADLALKRALDEVEILRDECNGMGLRYATLEIALGEIRRGRVRVRDYMDPKRREETAYG